MIYCNEEKLKQANNWSDNSIHILTDFDRTITRGNSPSSWSLIAKSNLLPDGYIEERNKLFDYYRPIEIDEAIEAAKKNKLMTEWWIKHINLLIKYKLSKDTLEKTIANSNLMIFRAGAKKFLENMAKRNIPVIIISAGIGNFIIHFLEINKCNFKNIYIISNFLEFKDNLATGISNKVIHSFNKNETALPPEIKELIKDRRNIILFGDSVSDIKMITDTENTNVLKIGFLEENIEQNLPFFKEAFDVISTNNTSFDELSNKISILKKQIKN